MIVWTSIEPLNFSPLFFPASDGWKSARYLGEYNMKTILLFI